MKSLRLTICVACALGACAVQSQALRTLATHEEPSKEQLALITVPAEKLDAEAKKLNVELVRDGEDVLMWDADLYNIRKLDLCMKGYDALAAMLRSGRTEFKLSELSEDDRKSVREILLARGLGEMYGPVLFDDNAPVQLSMSWHATMESGGKKTEATFRGNDNYGKLDDLPKHTRSEISDFVKNELPKRQTKLHPIDVVRFTCGSERMPSARRAAAVKKIMAIMEQRMTDQAKAFEDKLGQLVKAYGGADAVDKGVQVRSLNQTSREEIAERLRVQGFGDKAAIDGFLGSATVTGSDPYVTIGMHFNTGSGPSGFSVPTRVFRGG